MKITISEWPETQNSQKIPPPVHFAPQAVHFAPEAVHFAPEAVHFAQVHGGVERVKRK